MLKFIVFSIAAASAFAAVNLCCTGTTPGFGTVAVVNGSCTGAYSVCNLDWKIYYRQIMNTPNVPTVN